MDKEKKVLSEEDASEKSENDIEEEEAEDDNEKNLEKDILKPTLPSLSLKNNMM